MRQQRQGSVRPVTRKRLLIVTVSILFLGACIWVWVTRKDSSDLVFRQFVAAVERKDVPTIYSLTLDEEKSKMGVTKEVIARVLDGTVYQHAAQVKYIPSLLDRHYGARADRWHTRAAAWADATTRKPIESPHKTGQLQTIVDLFLSHDGQWRVSFTRFAASYVIMNITRPQLERKGLPTAEDRRRARDDQQRILAQWGISQMLPNPPITRVHGRNVVLEDKRSEGGSAP